MLLIILGIYTAFLSIIWGIFIITKIISDKFVFLNKKISSVNKFFFAILIFFTILGLILVVFIDFRQVTKVDENNIENILHY